MAKVRLGPAKPGWKVTPKDFEEYPVWVNDLDEENYDEEHEKPLLGVQAVDAKMTKLGFVSLGMKVVGTKHFARGVCEIENRRPYVSDVLIWKRGKWRDLNEIEGLAFPLLLESSVRVGNRSNPRFVLPNAESRRADLAS